MRYFPSTNRQALLCISRPFKKVIDWHLIYLKNKQLFQKYLSIYSITSNYSYVTLVLTKTNFAILWLIQFFLVVLVVKTTKRFLSLTVLGPILKIPVTNYEFCQVYRPSLWLLIISKQLPEHCLLSQYVVTYKIISVYPFDTGR